MKKLLVTAAWLLLPLIAVVYLALGIHQTARVPDAQDWQAAAQIVRDGWQEGDLVIFSPSWASAGAPHFQGLKIDMAEVWDLYEFSKVSNLWVIGSLGERNPDVPAAFEAVSSQKAGKITVHHWRSLEKGKLVYSFLENIKDAKVQTITEEKTSFCTNFTQGRWYCGPVHDWKFAGPIERDIDGRMRKVIWAHPPGDAGILEATWSNLPHAKRLTVHFGQTQRAIEQNRGTPATVKIWFGEKLAMERVLQIDDGIWYRVDFDVKPDDLNQVKISVTAQNKDMRIFCFTADLWN